jgi:hypothetical protein
LAKTGDIGLSRPNRFAEGRPIRAKDEYEEFWPHLEKRGCGAFIEHLEGKANAYAEERNSRTVERKGRFSATVAIYWNWRNAVGARVGRFTPEFALAYPGAPANWTWNSARR